MLIKKVTSEVDNLTPVYPNAGSSDRYKDIGDVSSRRTDDLLLQNHVKAFRDVASLTKKYSISLLCASLTF